MTESGKMWWWQKYATGPDKVLAITPAKVPVVSPALCYPGEHWHLSSYEAAAAQQMFKQTPWPPDIIVAIPAKGPNLWEPGKGLAVSYTQARLIRELHAMTLPSGVKVCYWVAKNPETYGWIADSRLFETASIAMEFASTGNPTLIHSDYHPTPQSGYWTVQNPPLMFDWGPQNQVYMGVGVAGGVPGVALSSIEQQMMSAYYVKSAETTVLEGLTKALPALNSTVECPAHGQPLPDTRCDCTYCIESNQPEQEKCDCSPDILRRVVVHLNDNHKWTREQIADWLDSLSLDLRFPDPVNQDAA